MMRLRLIMGGAAVPPLPDPTPLPRSAPGEDPFDAFCLYTTGRTTAEVCGEVPMCVGCGRARSTCSTDDAEGTVTCGRLACVEEEVRRFLPSRRTRARRRARS